MKRCNVAIRAACVVLLFCAYRTGMADEKLAQHLQDVSVTVAASSSGSLAQGSGVIVTRQLKLRDGSDEVLFIRCDAHHYGSRFHMAIPGAG